MVYFVLLLTLFISSCQSPSAKKDAAKTPELSKGEIAKAAARPPDPGKVMPEVSLKEDRKAVEELRLDIPEDTKHENDESASISKLFAGGDIEPQKIRERFEKMIRGSREKMDKILRKKREDYSKNEKKKRDAFLKKLAGERKKFASGKPTPAQRTEFDRDQDADRKDFFANERDDRKEFESEVSEQRHTFEDYAREKRADFDQLWREYRSAFDHRKRALEKKQEMTRKQMRMEADGKAIVSPAAVPVIAPTPPPEEQTNPAASSTAPLPPATPPKKLPAKAPVVNAQPLNAGGTLPSNTPDPDLEDFKKIPKGPGQPLVPPKDGK